MGICSNYGQLWTYPRLYLSYKTKKKHTDESLKYKARLVVRRDQQNDCDLPTRATVLAVTSLRAKFDLETPQLDAGNAFVHAVLDELVYTRPPPGFTEPGRVLKLDKALYGLRRSPTLWQTKITNAIKSLGFDELPQEPCVMIKDGMICYYSVSILWTILCLIEESSRRR
jgi:hypothetical protein